MEAQVKMDMRLGINMDSYTDLDYEGKVEMSKLRAKIDTIEAVIAKMRENFLSSMKSLK